LENLFPNKFSGFWFSVPTPGIMSYHQQEPELLNWEFVHHAFSGITNTVMWKDLNNENVNGFTLLQSQVSMNQLTYLYFCLPETLWTQVSLPAPAVNQWSHAK